MIPERLRTTLDPWRLLGRIASASTGKPVQVVPGRLPQVLRTPGAPHYGQIRLPEGLVAARSGPRPPKASDTRSRRPCGILTERQLLGSFCHEELHVLYTDPEAFAGVPLGPGLVGNCLEDHRVEHQGLDHMRGLVPPTRAALRETLSFALRSKQVAASANTRKLFQVGVCLYLGLTGVSWDRVARVTSDMACAVAQELFPLAGSVSRAESAWEVVEIATEICARMVEAAKRVAARTGTAASSRWVSSLRREIRTAMSRTLDELLIAVERRKYPGVWFGPWYRGMLGGYRFHTHLVDASPGNADPLRLPPRQEIERLLAKADPLDETTFRIRGCPSGQLQPSVGTLVRASLGKDRCLFERVSVNRLQLLLSLLAQTEFLLFIDGHARYADEEWFLLRRFVGTTARLLDLVRAPLCVVRSYHATRDKEWVENPRTKQRFQRWSNDIHLNITAIKDPEALWDTSCERVLANLDKTGFGLPLEGYPQLMRFRLRLPPASRRQRVVVCVGNALQINVLPGGDHLRAALAPLGKDHARVLYVHVGPWLHTYEAVYREVESAFDGLIQEETLPSMLVHLLHSVLRVLADRSG